MSGSESELFVEILVRDTSYHILSKIFFFLTLQL